MTILPSGVDSLLPTITSAANANGIPVPLYQALIQKESQYNSQAYNTNKNGTVDIGPAQINSVTANSLGINAGDTTTNINTGAQILAQNYAQTGNWTDALSMYNTGQKAANSSAGTDYANTVMGIAKKLGYNPSTTPAPSSLTTPIPLTPESIQRSKDALNSNPLTKALLDAITKATTWTNQHIIIVGLVVVGGFLIIEGVATGFKTPNTTQIINQVRRSGPRQALKSLPGVVEAAA